MPTGQAIINNALTALNVLEQGGVPSSSDSTDALGELNAMWDAWGIDEGLIYAVLTGRYPLTAGIGTYTIGTPASTSTGPQPNFRAARPGRIYAASVLSASGGAINANSLFSGGTGYAANDTGVILGAAGTQATYLVNTVSAGVVTAYTLSGAGTGYVPMFGAETQTAGAQPGAGTGLRISIASVTAGGQNRNELNIIEQGRYYAHNDLQATASTPDDLYPDYNVNTDGYATLYLYPVPLVLAAMNLELSAGVAFSTWALGTNYRIPQGYQDAIQYALAFRLLPRYGAIVDAKVAEAITALGTKAEARIRAMNASNRQIPPERAGLQPPAAKE